jgi:hypothetical protein
MSMTSSRCSGLKSVARVAWVWFLCVCVCVCVSVGPVGRGVLREDREVDQGPTRHACVCGHQPTNQPTDQPTNRPTDQPTNQPTNQPARRDCKHGSSSPLAYLARCRGSCVYTGPMSTLDGTLHARSAASSDADCVCVCVRVCACVCVCVFCVCVCACVSLAAPQRARAQPPCRTGSAQRCRPPA